MNNSTGASCPDCGTPRNSDNTPCRTCAPHTSDARTAHAAQAEDLPPLHVRPYVGPDDNTMASGAKAGAGTASTPNAAPGPGIAPTAEVPGTPDDGVAPAEGGAPADGNAPGPQAGRKAVADLSPADPGRRDPHPAPARPPAPGGRPADSGRTAPGEQTSDIGRTGRAGPATSGVPQQPADTTMRLHAVAPDALAAPDTAGPPALPVSRTAPLAAPLAPPTTEPSPTDLHLFDSARRPMTESATAGSPAGPAAPPSRSSLGGPTPPGGGGRRRARVLAAGAVVAVIGTAGWMGGLFVPETTSQGGALPVDVRVSPQAPASGTPSTAPVSSSSGPPEESSPVFSSAQPSESASPSVSPSDSEPAEASAPAVPSDEPEASGTPTAAASTDAPEEVEEPDDDTTGTTLKRGDRGAEVAELQERLSSVYLYDDEINGRFDNDTQDAVRDYQGSRDIYEDEVGVYGPETRRRLEAETRYP